VKKSTTLSLPCGKGLLLAVLLLCSYIVMAQSVPGIRANGVIRNTGDTITVCQGTSIVYQSVATGASVISWRFNLGSPAIGSGAGNIAVTYNTVGVDSTIQVVSAGPQRDSMYIFVRVSNERPTAAYTFAPDNVCGNIPINFTNGSTGNGLSYVWNYGDGNTSTLTNPSYQFLNAIGPSGTTTYSVKLVVTNQVGCKDSVTRTVTVGRVPDASIGNAEPTVTFGPFNGVPTFRKCNNIPFSVFAFTNQSTTIATNTQYTIKWGDNSPDSTFTNWPTGTPITHIYTLGNKILTVEVRGLDGCIGIKRYNVFLGSNPGGGLISLGNTDVCTADSLRFVIDGIGNNPPGTLYTFLVNDGTAPQIFAHPPPVTVRHDFSQGSCSFNSSTGNVTYSNAFGAYLTISNPCGSTSPSVVPIYVSGRPRAQMEILPGRTVCTNSQVIIRNVSGFGGVVTPTGGTASTCSLTGKQVWSISPATGYTTSPANLGSLGANPQNSLLWTPGPSTFTVNFTVPGTYTVKLYISNDRCGIDSTVQTICVRNPPQASFTMSNRTACNNGTATITNTSPVGACNGDAYNWAITYLDPQGCGTGSNFAFVNGTTATSAAPQLSFNAPGQYVLTLTVSAIGVSGQGCPPAIARDTFTVKGSPRVTINPIGAVCVGNNISPTANVSNCYSSGTLTYGWSFPNGSPVSANTAIPGAISYINTGNYWAILQATNECGTDTDSAQVVITPPPVANAGIDREVCSGEPIGIGSQAVQGLAYQWAPASGLSNAATATPTVTLVYNGPSADTVICYALTVSAGANCSGTDTVCVRVKKRPDVTVTAVPTVICVGDSVVLTATGASAYSWSPSAGLSAVTGNPVIARPTATTTYQVIGTDNGCTDTAQATITVNNFTTVSAGPDTILCNNNTAVQLVGSPANGTWSGSNITSTGVFNAQAAGNGSYTVYYTFGSNNCNRTDSALITVQNPPVAFAGNDTTICQSGAGLALTGTPVGGTWSGSGQVSPGGQLNTGVAGVYTLVYTVGGGSCIGRDTVVVNIGGGVANNLIAPSQSICINTQPAVIVGQVATGGNGAPAYRWQQSTDNINWADIIPLQTGLNYIPPVLTVTTYYRRIATTALCGGAQGSTSQPVTITVNPDARALFTASDTIRCAPFNLANVITATPFANRNGTYFWYANGSLIGSNTTGIFPGFTIATAGQSVVIKLVTTSAFGCQPDSMQRTFITTTGVTAGFTKDTGAGCDTLRVNFTNTSTPLSNAFQYIWDFGNGLTSTAQQPGPVTYLSSPNNVDTTYLVTLKAYNGCDTTFWRDSIRVRANPKARFSVDTTFGCSPFTVNIVNSSKGGPSTYYWDFGNGASDTTTTLTSFSVTYNTGVTDTFTIRLIAENECKRDTSFINVVVAPNTIVPQVSVNGNQLFSCVPATIVFNNTTTGATSFVWNFGDGSALVNTTNQQTLVPHTYLAPGQYTIGIRMRNGCSDTTIFRQIEVFARPEALFNVNNNLFCAGDTVRVFNSSTNANAYRWNWGDGSTSVGVNPSHVYTAGGTYIITLSADRVVNQGIVCTDTAQRSVTVINRPTATISSNIVALNCAPFTLQASAVALGNETATWVITDTTVVPSVVTLNGGTAQYIFAKPGTFSIKLVLVNNAGCKDSTERTFTVYAQPDAVFTPAVISTCKTDTLVTYTNATTYSGIDPLQYRWWVNGQLIASGPNFSYQYQLGAALPPRTFTTSLIVVNQVGCSDTAVGTLTMQAPPRALFTLTNPNRCIPFGLPVNNTSLNATAYRWLLNGTLVSTQANPVFTIDQPATAYTVTLIADNAFGCQPDTLSQTFTSLARPSAIFTLNDSLSCTGSLNVVPVNLSTGANSYTWIWGDGTPNSNLPNTTHLYPLQGQYAITLIASDGTCTDTVTQTVRVAQKPVVDFNANQSVFCGGDTVSFINLSTLATAYLWDFGDGSTSTAVNPLHIYAQRANPYTVKLVATGTFGCKDSAVKANLILAKPLPGASFSVSPAPVINVPNYSFSFINTTQQNNNYRYHWNFGDGSLPVTTRDAAHLYRDTGSYQVKLAVFDPVSNCSDTAIRVVRITGFPGYLYVPNAFQPGNIQPQLRTFLPIGRGLRSYRLQIFTTWGQKVFETTSLDATGAPSEGWNGQYNGRDNYNQGKMVQQDVYIWRIDAFFLNNTEWKGMQYPGSDEFKRIGTLTIIR
jgi:PKD repeat protein